MTSLKKQAHARLRSRRSRARIHGTSDIPRLTVKRSLKHVYVQLIDDNAGRTLASASDKEIETKSKPVEIARGIGTLIAKKAQALGITKVVFDRGSYRYHGRVAAVADGAREAGIIF